MSWLSQDFDKKICLTCQHFKCGRKFESIGRDAFIRYDSVRGTCRLFHDYPRLINSPTTTGDWCHYKRWIELPDQE
ncbi:MAG: hypothetical protein MJ033_07940 [Victivallaceae bacterium]|nr:hypothetical protein [Victivallaceae bacterium]